MEIAEHLGIYPSTDDKNFQYEIARKQEFQEMKLDRVEPAPAAGTNFRHQVTIERFLSNKTDFDSMLLFHDPGTGKTRTSILVSEINKKMFDNRDYRALIITPKMLKRNYKEQLKAFDERYLPKDKAGKPISSKDDSKRYLTKLKKLTEKNYQFGTYATFAKLIESKTDEQLKSSYSNRVIVIDEAHNLRIQQNKSESKSTYQSFYRFLHAVENCKILLLTGTPIWDSPDEIATLMNLILPKEKELDYKNFEKKFFDKDGKLKNPQDLSKAFEGRVSFIRQAQDDVELDYQGSVKPWMKKMKIYQDEMSDFQYENLLKAKTKQVGTQQQGLRSFELEAANFVFPDGTYGSEGFSKHCKPIDKAKTKYKFKEQSVAKDVKENLSEYSSKFYAIVQEILKNPKELAFVYHPHVKTGGTFLLGLILEQFGFARTMGASKDKGLRYAIISSDAATKEQAEKILAAFNDPSNKNGEYIQVLIGSRQISIGVTLKNVLQTHIAVPHWNMSAIDQAIGRTIRFLSHEALGGKNKVRVFLHIATYKKKETVDVSVIKIAEDKDFKNKQIYRIMKKDAIDCPLNYKRNVSPFDLSHSRECDYEECNFECSTFQPTGMTNNVFDYNVPEKDILRGTYDLYYSDSNIEYIVKYLEYLFKFYFSLHFEQIASFISNMSKTLLLKGLEYIINSKTTILLQDRFGFPSFLKEHNNIYFLDPNISSPSFDYRNLYYIEHPIIREDVSMSDIIDVMRINSEKGRVKYFCELAPDDESGIIEQLEEMDYKVRIGVLEAAYSALQVDSENEKAQIVFDHMSSFVYTIINYYVIERAFENMKVALRKDRNVVQYIEEGKQLGVYFDKGSEKSFNKLLKKYGERKKDNAFKQSMTSLMKKLEDQLKDQVREKDTVVHVLFSLEPSGTSYKKSLKATGLMRKFEDGRWTFVPGFLEEAYIEQIKDIDKLGEQEARKDNPFDAFGTLDAKGKFRIVEGKGKGFICSSISNKPKLIKLILSLREKEKELEGKTTLDPEIDPMIKKYKREQLILAIQGNTGKGMDVFKKGLDKKSDKELRILNTLMSSDVRNVLCPMIEKWFSEKGLYVEK